MNFRVILLVLLVTIFTICGVYLSVLSFQANSLKESYIEGDVEIIQNTTAGTVPHVIQVKNSGKKPLMVKIGQILVSNTSQDMVIAEDKWITQNTSSYIRAYCFQPNQSAVPGTKLIPTEMASSQIKQIIANSNLTDTQNTTKTQFEIWIIVTRDNLNITSGEASDLMEKNNSSNINISEQVNEAKNNIIKNFNITEGEIKNIKPNSSISINDLGNWIIGFINWIKNSFNIT